jgi:hypothetical protein
MKKSQNTKISCYSPSSLLYSTKLLFILDGVTLPEWAWITLTVLAGLSGYLVMLIGYIVYKVVHTKKDQNTVENRVELDNISFCSTIEF